MEHSDVLIWLPIAGFVALLSLAALIDFRERRIPNWLTGGVAALYPAYVLLSPTPVGWPGGLALAAAVFLFGLVLFARQLIGGGDVKLIAATTLWAGLDHLALFVNKHKNITTTQQIMPGIKFRIGVNLSNIYQQEAKLEARLRVRW